MFLGEFHECFQELVQVIFHSHPKEKIYFALSIKGILHLKFA